MIEVLLENKYFIGIGSALGSVLLTILTQHVLNRRIRLRYFVLHNRVGVSTDDAIFGSVKVTWNGNVIANLFLSTVELVNESMRDYENIVVRAFTDDTVLLTERTEIVGTTHFLKRTDEFSRELRVEPGQQPTQAQTDLYCRQRNFLIPTMNRGQAVRFTFLNAAKTQNQPSIWLDVLHKGIKLEFGVAHNQILGVAQPTAALVGSVIGLFIIGLIVCFANTIWFAAIVSFVYGLFAQIPGALAVKAWRWLQHFFGG
jgi:hypothetical protein